MNELLQQLSTNNIPTLFIHLSHGLQQEK